MENIDPNFSIFRRGQIWKYKKSAKKRVITGWKNLNINSVSALYNHGDINYYKKLLYVRDFMK
ncbi:hypothetical protein GCM10022398_03710 [Acetobacter lovaniensis]|jgi:FMN-dependent NADH-azoreductase|uniref:hypothetical protein n=1 Tax=Acetobacter sp. TaxID=440 RepID=UPI0021568751|nr:hypothetical protein AA0474_2715 [Acetobacter lovaniensis NRIC 0474]